MPINPTENPELLATKGLHLFHFSTSNCSMRIRLLLEEKGIDWVDRYVDLHTQANLTPEYFEISPKGLVPAIIHNGTIVYESADILEYIEEKFPSPSFLPKSEAALAEMNDWLEFTRANHVSAIKTWVYGRNKRPTKTKEAMPGYEAIQKDQELIEFHRMTLSDGFIPEERIKAAEATMLERFARIDAMVADQPFMQGDAPTLADIAWIPQYALMQRNGFPFEHLTNFMAWVQRWKERESYQKAIVKYMPSAA